MDCLNGPAPAYAVGTCTASLQGEWEARQASRWGKQKLAERQIYQVMIVNNTAAFTINKPSHQVYIPTLTRCHQHAPSMLQHVASNNEARTNPPTAINSPCRGSARHTLGIQSTISQLQSVDSDMRPSTAYFRPVVSRFFTGKSMGHRVVTIHH
jgi:hypothetical protein